MIDSVFCFFGSHVWEFTHRMDSVQGRQMKCVCCDSYKWSLIY